MRIKISFHVATDRIDVNYSYSLASMIYRAIERANPSLSLELHKPKTFKFFTFSRLMIPNRKFRIEDDEMIIESDNAHFFFSTAKNEIAESLVEGLLKKPEVKIGRAKFFVSEIRILREKKIRKREKFVTLSPICVSTLRDNSIWDISPSEKKFYENLKNNLIKKYKLLYGRDENDMNVKIKVLKAKRKRIKIKNTHRICYDLVFEAKGSKELLEVGYKTGFGERNSMGFGMVKVV